MLLEMKRKSLAWQRKQARVQRVAFVSGTVVLAVLATMIWKLSTGSAFNWVIAVLLAAAFGITFLFALSVYTNTTLVQMYYTACAHFLEKSEELELHTGTISKVEQVRLPYIGQLYLVTIETAGQSVRYYFPGKLLVGLHLQERVRVLTHDRFAVRVESTAFVEPTAESTQTA